MNRSTVTNYELLLSNFSSQLGFEICKFYYELLNNNSIGFFEIPQICRKYTPTQEVFIGLILSILTFSTLVGNILIIIAVTLVKKLQTPSNLLIVNLATSDLLVSGIVLPFAIIFQLKGFWPFSEFLCDTFILSDVLLCTCSILSLCIISIDRYFAITRPLQYASKRTTGRISIMIVSVWVLAGLISVPPFIGWKEKFVKNECKYSDSLSYQIYATFGAFYVPLFIMLFLYGKILLLAKRIANLDLKQRSQKTSRRNSTVVFSNHNTTENRKPSLQQTMNCSFIQHDHRESNDKSEEMAFSKRYTITKLYNRTSMNLYKKSKLSSEVKAIKTLGIIMGCFTICWCPFFIIQLTIPIAKALGQDPNFVPPTVIEIFLWLGYFNSFLNPIIYAKFNRDFRTPFKEILLFRCRTINRRMRSESYVEQYGMMNRRRSTLDVTYNNTARKMTKTREDFNNSLRFSRK
uniref:GCR026 n=1 Tax=Schmidtea mediterranea TaxID=79327 RepID=A0A193KUH0_SCHMD|nr:GCR026 [Schmidtea mediterranea]